MDQQQKLILGYWDIPGTAQQIRLLLEYLQLPYENYLYKIEIMDEWRKKKNQVGLDFPNLPYLIDGEFKFSESLTIMCYLAEKANRTDLLGHGVDQFKVDSLKQLLNELTSELFKICFHDLIEPLKSKIWEEKIHFKLQKINLFRQNKKLLHGYITINDFQFYYFLQCMEEFLNSKFQENGFSYKQYMCNFEENGKIQQFQKNV